MFSSVEIATALTEAWIRDGAPNKRSKEVADFYCALYDALEESQRKKFPKIRSSIDTATQLTCGGVVVVLTTIWILLAMFVK